MKSNFTLRNKFFYFFIIGYFLINLPVEAQVVYTDINPDDTVSTNGGVYQLDLNNDGIIDFNINFKTTIATSTLCTGSKTNHYVTISPVDFAIDKVGSTFDTYDSLYYMYPIDSNILIDNSINYDWISDSAQEMVSVRWTCRTIKTHHVWGTITSGEWGGAIDEFLGLKIAVGNNTYYGWARLTMGSLSFTIKDYAYNSTPDGFIFAGQRADEFLTVSEITGSPFCSGNNFNIAYTAYGNFDSSNVFTAELSDSAGGFTTPVVIGTLHNNVSDTIHATIPLGSAAGYLYRIRITSSNPAAIIAINNADLIVDSYLLSTHISTYDTTNFCPGFYAVLDADWGDTYSYQWTRDGVNLVPSEFFDPNEYPADTAGVYRCTITNTCGSVTSDSIVITNIGLSTVTINAAGSLWICPGQSVVFNCVTTGGTYYEWYRNGISLSGANQLSYVALQGGRYWVMMTDSNGCSGYSNQDTLTLSNPLATITAGGPTIFCAGDSVVLSQTANTDASFTFQWLQNNIDIPGATSQTYTVMQSGFYTIRVTNPAGNCSSVSAVVDVTAGCTGIDEKVPSTSHLLINPNPAVHFMNIERTTNKSATVQIINHFGQIIFYETVNSSKATIDVNMFPEGVYFLKWVESDFTESKQFTVIK